MHCVIGGQTFMLLKHMQHGHDDYARLIYSLAIFRWIFENYHLENIYVLDQDRFQRKNVCFGQTTWFYEKVKANNFIQSKKNPL